METPDLKPITQPTESSERNGKEHVPEDLESDPSLSDSSPSESDSSYDRKYRRSKSKGNDKEKKHQKHTKQNSSDLSLRDSDFSDKIDYRRKICNKNKSHWKKDPIKLCVKLMAKLLTTAYKSNIIKFKLDEYRIQRQIYFLTFV